MSEQAPPDLDTLADYLEGLLPDATRREVERWISTDARTASLVRELEDLPALLAAEPAEPMPPDVVGRVEDALAEESSRAVEDRSTVTVLPVRRRRWLAPAVAAAMAVGVVGVGAQVVDSGGESPGAADSAGMARSQPPSEAADSAQGLAGPEGSRTPNPRARNAVPDNAQGDALNHVSLETFRADVAGVLRDRAVHAGEFSTLSELTTAADRIAGAYSIVDDDCAVELGRGRYARIRLDGQPALLALRRIPDQPRRRRAVAYPAECPDGDSSTEGSSALVRATITLP